MTTPPKETWINTKIEVRETQNKGKGVFAIEPIKTGETILVWGREYSNARGAKEAKAKGKRVLQWDDDLYSVEDRGDDMGYFINHSCDSNTWMDDAYSLIAKRNIQTGEEVTADYSLWEADPNSPKTFRIYVDSSSTSRLPTVVLWLWRIGWSESIVILRTTDYVCSHLRH